MRKKSMDMYDTEMHSFSIHITSSSSQLNMECIKMLRPENSHS